MNKAEWFDKIKESCESAGTYRPYFDSVIDTLAGILDKRDEAMKVFEQTGGNVIVTHTNKAGAKNLEQNPALRLANDLNRDALAYWRDLGLTPAGLRKLNAEILEKQNKSGLEELLSTIK